MTSSSSSKYNAVDYLVLSEFDIDSGSTVRHIYPSLPKGYERDWFANYMLPEGVHNRSLDSTFIILNREGRYVHEEKWAYPHSDNNSTLNSNNNDNNDNNKNDDTNTGSSNNYLLYGLNLVKTEYDSNVRRGAVVKAIAIFSKYHYVNIFRSPLSKALDLYFADPKAGETVLKDLYSSLNTLQMEKIPVWNEIQRALAVRWMGVNGYSVVARERETRGSVHHVIGPKYHDLNLNYAGINFAFNVPLYRSPDQVGDGSISKLVALLGTDVMKIYNAVLARRRVLFVGYGMAAMDIAALVLATVQLVSPPLVGVIRRAFPYATITDMSFLETEGYIAGVTNPMFANHQQWWDVLCTIEMNENTGHIGGTIGGTVNVAGAGVETSSSQSIQLQSSSNQYHSNSEKADTDINNSTSSTSSMNSSNPTTPDSKSKTKNGDISIDIPHTSEATSSSSITGDLTSPTPSSPSSMYYPTHPQVLKQFRGNDYRATVVIAEALESQSQLSLQALAITSASAASKSKSKTNNKNRKQSSTQLHARDTLHQKDLVTHTGAAVISPTLENIGEDEDDVDAATTSTSWAQTQTWLANTFTAFTADDVRFSNHILAGLSVDSKRLGEDWLRQEFRDYTTDRLERALRLGLGRSHSSSIVSDSGSVSTCTPSSVAGNEGITPDIDDSESSDDKKSSSSSALSPTERPSQVSMPMPIGVTSPKTKKSFLRRSDPSRVGGVTLELERGTQAAQLLESPEVQNMACDPWLWAHQLDNDHNNNNNNNNSSSSIEGEIDYGGNGLRLRQYVRILQGRHYPDSKGKSSSSNASEATNADFLFLGPVVDMVGEGAQTVTTVATAAGIGIGVGLGIVPEEVESESQAATNSSNSNSSSNTATKETSQEKAVVENESTAPTSIDTTTTANTTTSTTAPKFANVNGNDSGYTVDMFVALEKATRTRGGCMALVSLLPESVGGLSCIAIGIYHSSFTAAEAAAKILEHCESYEETKMAVMCLSPFLLRARSDLLEHIRDTTGVKVEFIDKFSIASSASSHSGNRSRSGSASSASSSVVRLTPSKTFLST